MMMAMTMFVQKSGKIKLSANMMFWYEPQYNAWPAVLKYQIGGKCSWKERTSKSDLF